MRKGRLAVLWIGVTVALLAGIDPAWYSLAALHQSLDDWYSLVVCADSSRPDPATFNPFILLYREAISSDKDTRYP